MGRRSAKRKSSKDNRFRGKEERGPKKWKTVDMEDIVEDGLVPFVKGEGMPLRFDTYKSEADPTKWIETKIQEGDVVVDVPELRSALSTAYADKVAGNVSGAECRVTYRGSLLPDRAILQIPFQKQGQLEVVTFRAATRFMIPDDNRHRVQRRVHRWTGVSLPNDVTDALLTKEESHVIGEKGGDTSFRGDTPPSKVTSVLEHGKLNVYLQTQDSSGETTKERIFP